jgi:hypothetical protein
MSDVRVIVPLELGDLPFRDRSKAKAPDRHPSPQWRAVA